jgi:hypothetical protein
MVPMSGLWVLPLIALFSTIVLIYFVYLRARRNIPALIWVLMLFFFLLWTVGEFAQKWLGEDLAVLKWMTFCIVFGDIFPVIFLVFTLMFPSPNPMFMRHQKVLLIIIVVPKIASTIVTLSNPDLSKPDDWDEFWSGNNLGYYPFILALRHMVSGIGDWYFFLGIGHTLILLAVGAFVLVSNYWRTDIDSVRRATRVILIGLVIYIIIGASTGFILPLMGYFPPELFGLGVLLLNFIVAFGLLQGQVLLFSPAAETKETRDYSNTLKSGDYYLCSTKQGIETFTELVTHGYEGLYVGAVKPNLDITKFKRTPIVILTEAGKGLRQYGNLQYVPADELKTFKASIFTFIKSATRGVIFLDNMDVILEKGWAHPREFVEMGIQMRDAQVINAIWLFGTPIKDDPKIEKLRTVMEYPVIKKAIVLDKLNRILDKIDVERALLDDQLKRLSRVEPIFGYIKIEGDNLVFDEDLGNYGGILEHDPTNPIRLFVQQFQSHIPMEAYKDILQELHDYGISRFEFLLRPGDSYIIEETFQDRGRTYDVYLDFMEKGLKGICITRTEPTKLRQRYLLPPDSDIFWLTQDRKEEKDIKPAPEYLWTHIKNFIESHGREPGVILLDGLEYLITFQGDQFDSYLKVLRRISDLISQSKLILLIPYDPDAIPTERIALFRRSGIEVITKDMLT